MSLFKLFQKQRRERKAEGHSCQVISYQCDRRVAALISVLVFVFQFNSITKPPHFPGFVLVNRKNRVCRKLSRDASRLGGLTAGLSRD